MHTPATFATTERVVDELSLTKKCPVLKLFKSPSLVLIVALHFKVIKLRARWINVGGATLNFTALNLLISS